MPVPSDEDLQKIRDDNEKLRAKIRETQSTRATREAEASRVIEYEQLKAEQVRLEAQLANEKELAKVGSVKAGSENVLSSVKEQLAEATAVAEAPAGPVDTNAESSNSENGGNS